MVRVLNMQTNKQVNIFWWEMGGESLLTTQTQLRPISMSNRLGVAGNQTWDFCQPELELWYHVKLPVLVKPLQNLKENMIGFYIIFDDLLIVISSYQCKWIDGQT